MRFRLRPHLRLRRSWTNVEPDALATAAPRLRRRTHLARGSRIPWSGQARRRRHLSELCDRLCGLEGQGAADRRQCANAILHRASAPPARTRYRSASGAL